MNELPWSIEREDIVNGGRFRIHIQRVRLPDGSTAPFSYVDVRPTVCVLPILKQNGDEKIVCIRQYRHALKQWIYELPAGMHYPMRSTVEETAALELRGETGYMAERYTHLGQYQSSPGSTNETVLLTLATGLTRVSYTPDPAKIIEVCPLPVAEFERMVIAGEFTMGAGLVAWLLYKQKIASGTLPAPTAAQPAVGSKHRRTYSNRGKAKNHTAPAPSLATKTANASSAQPRPQKRRKRTPQPKLQAAPKTAQPSAHPKPKRRRAPRPKAPVPTPEA